jgi:hypothetical protein
MANLPERLKEMARERIKSLAKLYNSGEREKAEQEARDFIDFYRKNRKEDDAYIMFAESYLTQTGRKPKEVTSWLQ